MTKWLRVFFLDIECTWEQERNIFALIKDEDFYKF